jgi:hypothetical protein
MIMSPADSKHCNKGAHHECVMTECLCDCHLVDECGCHDCRKRLGEHIAMRKALAEMKASLLVKAKAWHR